MTGREGFPWCHLYSPLKSGLVPAITDAPVCLRLKSAPAQTTAHLGAGLDIRASLLATIIPIHVTVSSHLRTNI